MREKRRRKLQEEQVTSTNQKDAALSAPAASPPASEPSAQPQTTVRQRIALKHKSYPLPAAPEAPQKSSPERTGDRTPSMNTPSQSDTPKPSTSPVLPVQLAEGTIQTETKGMNLTLIDGHIQSLFNCLFELLFLHSNAFYMTVMLTIVLFM